MKLSSRRNRKLQALASQSEEVKLFFLSCCRNRKSPELTFIEILNFYICSQLNKQSSGFGMRPSLESVLRYCGIWQFFVFDFVVFANFFFSDCGVQYAVLPSVPLVVWCLHLHSIDFIATYVIKALSKKRSYAIFFALLLVSNFAKFCSCVY